MADHSDKPPILRVLVLLVALVGVALTLSALSPALPEPADTPPSGADTAVSISAQPAAARP